MNEDFTAATSIGGTFYSVNGSASWGNQYVSTEVKVDTVKGIHPKLYFSFVKKKFGFLEGMRIQKRLKALEKAFDKAVENGQDALAKKFLDQVFREAKESELYAKGYRLFIDKEVLHKHKHRIRGGHISDTAYQDYTRVIPKDVVAKKKKAESFFNGFVIYHYWSPEAEDVKSMTPEEKERMKDPILFGICKECPEKLFFIADWEDEYCDLSFDELVDHIGLDDEDVKLSREVKL